MATFLNRKERTRLIQSKTGKLFDEDQMDKPLSEWTLRDHDRWSLRLIVMVVFIIFPVTCFLLWMAGIEELWN